MALFNFDDTADAKSNERRMTKSLEEILTGQVTYAVRDSEVNGVSVKTGDRIGLLNGEIVMTDAQDEVLVERLIEAYQKPEHTLITIYVGHDADADKAQKLSDTLALRWPDYEVECIHGGQPVYSYIFSME